MPPRRMAYDYSKLVDLYAMYPEDALEKLLKSRHKIFTNRETRLNLVRVAMIYKDNEQRITNTPARTRSAFGETRMIEVYNSIDYDIEQFSKL